MQTDEVYCKIPGGYPCPQGDRVLLFYCGEWLIGHRIYDSYFDENGGDPLENLPTAWASLPRKPQ